MLNKKTFFKKSIPVFASLIAVILFWALNTNKTQAIVAIPGDVTGWAWGSDWTDLNGNGTQDTAETPSGGIGWLSFSSKNCDTNDNGTMDQGDTPLNPACPINGTLVSSYGVNIDPTTKNFSGYAWSSNLGWLRFDPSFTGPSGAGAGAKIDSANNVVGWARFCSVFASGCSGATKNITGVELGGWDGWVRMSDSPSAVLYGVKYDSNSNKLTGYAWGGNDSGANVVGWINFSNVSVNPFGSVSVKLQVNGMPVNCPADAGCTQTNPVKIIAGNPINLSWTGVNVVSPCNATDDWTGAKNISTTPTTQTNATTSYLNITSLVSKKYTLNCNAKPGFSPATASSVVYVEIDPAPVASLVLKANGQPIIAGGLGSTSANPVVVKTGDNIALSWNTNLVNIDTTKPCPVSWGGTVGASFGPANITAINTSNAPVVNKYTINCTATSGSIPVNPTSDVYVQINPVASVWLKMNGGSGPSSNHAIVNAGQPMTLTWGGVGLVQSATGCKASIDWSGNKISPAGTEQLPSSTSLVTTLITKHYTIVCLNSLGQTPDPFAEVYVDIVPGTVPSINLSANNQYMNFSNPVPIPVTAGQSFTLGWWGQGIQTNCTASANPTYSNWNGPKVSLAPQSNPVTQSVPTSVAITAPYTWRFNLSCTSANPSYTGPIKTYVDVKVIPACTGPNCASLKLNANGQAGTLNITAGTPINLKWNSTGTINAINGCSASGDWTGTRSSPSGSEPLIQTSSITVPTTKVYSLTCASSNFNIPDPISTVTANITPASLVNNLHFWADSLTATPQKSGNQTIYPDMLHWYSDYPVNSCKSLSLINSQTQQPVGWSDMQSVATPGTTPSNAQNANVELIPPSPYNLSQTSWFGLQCNDVASGNTITATPISVNTLSLAESLNLSAPNAVSNGRVDLVWTGSNIKPGSCSAFTSNPSSGTGWNWSGGNGSGTQTSVKVPAISPSLTTYNISCTTLYSNLPILDSIQLNDLSGPVINGTSKKPRYQES